MTKPWHYNPIFIFVSDYIFDCLSRCIQPYPIVPFPGMILHGGNEGKRLPSWNDPVEHYNFFIGCPFIKKNMPRCPAPIKKLFLILKGHSYEDKSNLYWNFAKGTAAKSQGSTVIDVGRRVNLMPASWIWPIFSISLMTVFDGVLTLHPYLLVRIFCRLLQNLGCIGIRKTPLCWCRLHSGDTRSSQLGIRWYLHGKSIKFNSSFNQSSRTEDLVSAKKKNSLRRSNVNTQDNSSMPWSSSEKVNVTTRKVLFQSKSS